MELQKSGLKSWDYIETERKKIDEVTFGTITPVPFDIKVTDYGRDYNERIGSVTTITQGGEVLQTIDTRPPREFTRKEVITTSGKKLPTDKFFDFTANKLQNLFTKFDIFTQPYAEKILPINVYEFLYTPRKGVREYLSDTLKFAAFAPIMTTTAQVERSIIPQKIQVKVAGVEQIIKDKNVKTEFVFETSTKKSGKAVSYSSFIENEGTGLTLAKAKTGGVIGKKILIPRINVEKGLFKEVLIDKVPFKISQTSIFKPAKVKITVKDYLSDFGLTVKQTKSFKGYTVNSIGKITTPNEAKIFSGKAFGYNIKKIGISASKTATKKGDTVEAIGLIKRIKLPEIFKISKPTRNILPVEKPLRDIVLENIRGQSTQQLIRELPPLPSITKQVQVQQYSKIGTEAFSAGVSDITKAVVSTIKPSKPITITNIALKSTSVIKLSSKQLSIQSQLQEPKLKSLQETKQITKQIPRELQAQVPRQIESQMTRQLERQLPRQVQLQKTRMLPPPITIRTGFVFPVEPPIFFTIPTKKRKFKKFKRKSSGGIFYTPSFTARTLGLTRKVSRKTLGIEASRGYSSLELRGIPLTRYLK